MKTPRRPVVITGVGCVTPLGRDAASTWAAIRRGQSGVGRIAQFDPTGFPVRIAGEVKGFDPRRDVPEEACPRKLQKYLDRKTAFAVLAAREALAHARLAQPGASAQAEGRAASGNGDSGAVAPERFGIAIGTEAGRPLLQDIADRILEAKQKGIESISLDALDPVSLVKETPSLPTSLLAMIHGARGPASTISTACTSSSQSIGDAFDRIRRGEADVMLAGGCDALVEAFMVTGFSLLGALSQRNDEPERASRPFDMHRDGFVLAEGAGFLVLESREHAEKRGAPMLAELAGFGASDNAYRITDSPPDGRGAYLSMKFALADAGLAPEAVGYVNAHGTSTQQNDASETAGIKWLFGDRAKKVPVSSTKSMMGHLVAACGAVELVVTVLAMRDRVAPPTINYESPDPSCDLDYVPNVARPCGFDVALSNSFGFGGSNGTIALKRLAQR